MRNFDILYPIDNRPSVEQLLKDYEEIKSFVAGKTSFEDVVLGYVSWSMSHQGYDFWSRTRHLPEHREEAVSIFLEVVGGNSFNEDDIWD